MVHGQTRRPGEMQSTHAKKKIALLASTQDAASMNVYAKLISEKQHWKKSSLVFENSPVYLASFSDVDATLFLTQKKSVYCEHIDEEIAATLGIDIQEINALIFITKHDSKSGRPSFSVHTQGNWNKAELGGNPQELATCPVVLKHLLFRSLERANNVAGFEVVNECTHHGPSITVPSVFIEIGSTQTEWQRSDAGVILASAIESALSTYVGEIDCDDNRPTIIGIGGTHTCSNFTRLVSEEKIYLSHVCPTYAIDTVTAEVIKQSIEKTTLRETCMLTIDWKSMSAVQRQKIIGTLQELRLHYTILGDLKKELDAPQNTKAL